MKRTPLETAAAAQQLLARLMPGPWCWSGRPEDVRLCTAHSGRHYLMGARRKGMRGTQYTFQWFDQPPRGQIVAAADTGLYVARAPYAQDEIVDIAHPLAQLIKMLPELVTALAALSAEAPDA